MATMIQVHQWSPVVPKIISKLSGMHSNIFMNEPFFTSPPVFPSIPMAEILNSWHNKLLIVPYLDNSLMSPSLEHAVPSILLAPASSHVVWLSPHPLRSQCGYYLSQDAFLIASSQGELSQLFSVMSKLAWMTDFFQSWSHCRRIIIVMSLTRRLVLEVQTVSESQLYLSVPNMA